MALPEPLGGQLIDQVLVGAEREKALSELDELPVLAVGPEVGINAEMIATGVLSPMNGFVGSEAIDSICRTMHLPTGEPWTIPYPLAPRNLPESKEALAKAGVQEGQRIVLSSNPDRPPIALLDIEELFTVDKDFYCQSVFGTTNTTHPGCNYAMQGLGDTFLAGPIHLLRKTYWGSFERLRKDPADVRAEFEKRGWNSVVAFQTANPIHRGHEYLQKCALELHDGLFIHPIVETTRKAYFRNEFRLAAYDAALANYYPAERVVMAPLRVLMNYAGPKEAIMHAIIRRNFGCTHLILGRDHAGFKDFYDPYAAQHIFDDFEAGELGIEPLFFQNSFYCTRCSCMATAKTCPHPPEYHLTMSGTAIQDALRFGYFPPKEAMRPEVAQVAIQGIQPKGWIKGRAMSPPGNTVKGLMPWYLTHHQLGGYLREEPLKAEDLTLDDLAVAMRITRDNADAIYSNVARELTHFLEINRAVVVRQKTDSLQAAMTRQSKLIKDLEVKVSAAEERVSNPYMYQDKDEAQRELDTARAILEEIPQPLDPEQFRKRVWNPLDYDEYRG